MKFYQYIDSANTVVAVIDEDRVSRMSMLASAVPEGEYIAPYEAAPVPVPSSVTMRQARLALLGAGLLDSVNLAIDTIVDDMQRKAAQIEWEYAQEVQRSSGLVPLLGQALQLSEQDLDNLFLTASTL